MYGLALQMHGYPTILVAGTGCGQLIDSLRRDGYLVLEADDWEHVLDTIKRHSRPIHLLFGPDSLETHAPVVLRHRPELSFFFASRPYDQGAIAAAIKRRVAPPQQMCAQTNADARRPAREKHASALPGDSGGTVLTMQQSTSKGLHEIPEFKRLANEAADQRVVRHPHGHFFGVCAGEDHLHSGRASAASAITSWLELPGMVRSRRISSISPPLREADRWQQTRWLPRKPPYPTCAAFSRLRVLVALHLPQ